MAGGADNACCDVIIRQGAELRSDAWMEPATAAAAAAAAGGAVL